MEHTTISYTYKKDGNKWILTVTEYDPAVVSFNLLQSLISKKLHKCNYIKKIVEVPLYDGYRRITVYYNNDCKTDYYIPDTNSDYLLDMGNYIPFN